VNANTFGTTNIVFVQARHMMKSSTLGEPEEAVQVFVKLIKMVKIPQNLIEKSANSSLLASFLIKFWKIFPHFYFVPEYLHSL